MKKYIILNVLQMLLLLLVSGCGHSVETIVDITYKEQSTFWGEHIACGEENTVYYVRKGIPDTLVKKNMISNTDQELVTGENIHCISVADYIFFLDNNRIGCYDEKLKTVEYSEDLAGKDSSILAVGNQVVLSSRTSQKSHSGGVLYHVYNSVFKYEAGNFKLIDCFVIPADDKKNGSALVGYPYFSQSYQYYITPDEAKPFSYVVGFFYLNGFDYCSPGGYSALSSSNLLGFEKNGNIYLFTGGAIQNDFESYDNFIDLNKVCPLYTVKQFFEYRDTVYALAFYKGQEVPDSFCLVKLNLEEGSAEKIVDFSDNTDLIGFANELLYGIREDGTIFYYDIEKNTEHDFCRVDKKSVPKLELELSGNYIYVNSVYRSETRTELIKIADD